MCPSSLGIDLKAGWATYWLQFTHRGRASNAYRLADPAQAKAKVKAIPDGYHTATPYLFVSDAARAIEFYKAAFKAKELMRLAAPGGRVGYAQIKIGDSHIMLSDESPDMGARGPKTLGGSPVMLYLYVKDVDAVVDQAVAAPGSNQNAISGSNFHRGKFLPLST